MVAVEDEKDFYRLVRCCSTTMSADDGDVPAWLEAAMIAAAAAVNRTGAIIASPPTSAAALSSESPNGASVAISRAMAGCDVDVQS